MWAEPAVSTAPVGISRRDQVLAAVVLVAVSLEVATRPDSGWPPAAAGMGFVLTSAVLVRRSRCLVGVVLAFGAFLVVDVTAFAMGAAPVTLYSGAVVLLLVYSLFRWGAGRDVVFGMTVVVGEFTVATLTDSSGPMDAVGGAAVLMLSAALGAAVRYRGVAREQLIEQAKLPGRWQRCARWWATCGTALTRRRWCPGGVWPTSNDWLCPGKTHCVSMWSYVVIWMNFPRRCRLLCTEWRKNRSRTRNAMHD